MSQDEGIGMRWFSVLTHVGALIALCAIGADRAAVAMMGVAAGSSVNSLAFGYALQRGHLRRVRAWERDIAGGGK